MRHEKLDPLRRVELVGSIFADYVLYQAVAKPENLHGKRMLRDLIELEPPFVGQIFSGNEKHLVLEGVVQNVCQKLDQLKILEKSLFPLRREA
jgi:hypothetical protein